jgi:hypothetical protein
MRRHVAVWVAAFLSTVIVASGCGGDEDPAAVVPFTIGISPEFVQGVVPGETTGVLVTISDEEPTDQPVRVSVAVEGAEAEVRPAEIRQGEVAEVVIVAEAVAEVVIVAEAVAEERPLEIVVTGRRGELESTAVRSTTVRPWENSEQEYAETLVGLFASWLAENEPDLGIGPETLFAGSFVCPVLVVTHYLFLSDDWEAGLSWHVMVPPDDWAEIYLRPRDEAAPTLAFRLRSQDAALNGGAVEVSPVTPPLEVVR